MGLFGSRNKALAAQAGAVQAMAAPSGMKAPLPLGLPDRAEFNPKAQSRGFLGNIGNALNRMRENGGFERLAMASAFANGNHQAAFAIGARLRQQQQEAAEAEQASIAQQTLTKSLIARGMSPQDAQLAMLNPRALGEEFNTRFRTRELTPEQSVYTPGIGSAPHQLYTAPRIVEDGPNRVQIDPIAGTSRVVHQGLTGPQWDANSLGLEPGTPQYGTFLQDRILGAQGPTGTATTRRGQDLSAFTAQRGQDISATTTRRGQDVSAETSRRGQDIANSRGLRGQDMTDARGRRGQDMRVQSGRGRGRAGNAPVIVNPRTGQRMTLGPNGQWVPVR